MWLKISKFVKVRALHAIRRAPQRATCKNQGRLLGENEAGCQFEVLIGRPCVTGLIRDVDFDLSDNNIVRHSRSHEQYVANINRLGKSSKAKVAFSGALLPSYFVLGHVRIAVSAFQDHTI